MVSGAFEIEGDVQELLQYSEAAVEMTETGRGIDTEFEYRAPAGGPATGRRRRLACQCVGLNGAGSGYSRGFIPISAAAVGTFGRVCQKLFPGTVRSYHVADSHE